MFALRRRGIARGEGGVSMAYMKRMLNASFFYILTD